MDPIPRSHHHSISLPDHARPFITDAVLTAPQDADADLVLPPSRFRNDFVPVNLVDRRKVQENGGWGPGDAVAGIMGRVGGGVFGEGGRSLPSFNDRPPPSRNFEYPPVKKAVKEKETPRKKEVQKREVEAQTVKQTNVDQSSQALPAMNDKWVDELRELRDLVARQNAQLIWYQTQHPPPPPSSLSALLQSHKTTSATPTFRAYEDHLSSAEKAVEDMKKQVAKVEAEKVDLEGERDQAKRNVDIYRGKLQDLELRTCGKCGDQAVRVGELLTELEKLRFKMMTEEPAATKVEYLQARLRKLTPNLTSLVQLTSTQHKTISSLTSSASESARHLEDLTAQLEATSQDHKVLSQRCRLLEDEVETLRRFKREMDDARLWKRHWEESVEDHKECVSYLHSQSQIIPGLSLPTTSITHPSPRILPAIRHLVGKYRQAHAAHGAVEKAHAALLSKYVIDTEAKDARLNVAERHLDEVIKTAEGSKLARDAAILSAKKALREASEVEGRLRKVMLRKETEMEEIVQRINRQLRDVREVYDCDRMKAHQKIDELTKSKLELQTEIGDLLRDRRDRDFSRMPYSSAINAIRDEFRRDIRVTV